MLGLHILLQRLTWRFFVGERKHNGAMPMSMLRVLVGDSSAVRAKGVSSDEGSLG